MKNLFKGFYRLSDEEFKSLWANAIFVFDTNVLLNLYRYQSSTRDALLKVMERLSDRVWIPYHVGLEFQRNRLKVIAEQHGRYSEVENIVNNSLSSMRTELDNLQLKKRHSHIDPDTLVKKIENVKDEFFKELGNSKEQSISVMSNDQIRERIDTLFINHLGTPPGSQQEIDDLIVEGENRYKKAIPPGFKDSAKDEKVSDEFTYSGITYKRKYGDFIIWKQIIQHMAQLDIKDIIFVTDDNKSDWWWKIDSNGSKTIGARPELTDEISREASIERFYLYNTEGFLNYANKELGTQVANEILEEIREVSVARNESLGLSHRKWNQIRISGEKAVYVWLSSRFLHPIQRNTGFPDFIGYENNQKFGFEVSLIRDPRMIGLRLKDTMYKCYYSLNEDDFYEMAIIFVTLSDDEAIKAMRILQNRMPEMECNLKILVGKVDIDEDNGKVSDFILYGEVKPGLSKIP